MTTFTITEFQKEKFETKMTKFAKRAAKLGIEFGFELLETGQNFISENNVKFFFKTFTYTVHGESPIINGFTFLAKIEPVSDGVNMVHSHNTEINFSEYRSAKLVCQHCNKNVKRNFYFLIQNETGEVKMVGRNCLAQYISQPNAEEIAKFYSDFCVTTDKVNGEDEDDFGGDKIPRQNYTIEIKDFFPYVIQTIDAKGYRSVTNSDEYHPATKISVTNNFFAPKQYRYEPTPEQVAKSEMILAYVKENLTPKNEYENNIKTLLENGMMKIDHAGYVASIEPLYNRMINVVHENKNVIASQHVGTVGEKIENVKAIVSRTGTTEGFRGGTTYIYTFNSTGNILVWFSSNDLNLNVDDEITILSGTVKAHNSFNNKAQTIITRCKISK